jgi:hypothetical protein
MTKRILSLLAGGLLSACGAGATTGPSARTTLDSIPPPAAATFRSQAGTADVKVEHETERGRDLYEGSWWEGDLEREAKVTATGELVALEIQVREADVPAPVRDAVAKAMTGATKIKYVKLQGDRYEAEGVVNGAEHEMTFTAAGAAVTEPEDDDGEEDDDDEDGEHEGDHEH